MGSLLFWLVDISSQICVGTDAHVAMATPKEVHNYSCGDPKGKYRLELV